MAPALVYVRLQMVEIPVALLLADRMQRVSASEAWRAAQIPIPAMLLMVVAVVGAELLVVAGLRVNRVGGNVPARTWPAVHKLAQQVVDMGGETALHRGRAEDTWVIERLPLRKITRNRCVWVST